MTRLIAFLTTLFLLVSSASAQDQGMPDTSDRIDEPEPTPDPPQIIEARERVANGEAAFDREDYNAAIAEFERAYELLEGRPIRYLVLYNLAQCYERLFDYDRAMGLYRRYLAEGGDAAEDRADVEATIRALEGLLGTVRVTASEVGAEIWIDSRRVGTAPHEALVPSGRHVVEARAPGHLPARQEINVVARREVDVALRLEPIPERDEGLHPAFAVAAGSVAVIALATGIAVGVGASSQRSDVDAALAMGPSSAAYWRVSQDDKDEIAQQATTADVFFAVGALFAVTTGVLAFLTDWGGDEQPTASVSASTDGASVTVEGRF